MLPRETLVRTLSSARLALAAAVLPSCIAVAAQPLLARPLALIFDPALAVQLSQGIATTYMIGCLSLLIGTVGGFALAYALRFIWQGRRAARIALTVALYAAMSVPVYVLLIFGQAWILNQNVLAVAALSINLVVFVTKLVLAGFSSIRPEQLWAARITGARPFDILVDFEGRAIWRVSGAAIANEWATTLKLTSLIGVIGVYDIMNVAKNHSENTYDTTIFLVVIAAYAFLTIPLFLAADMVRRRAT